MKTTVFALAAIIAYADGALAQSAANKPLRRKVQNPESSQPQAQLTRRDGIQPAQNPNAEADALSPESTAKDNTPRDTITKYPGWMFGMGFNAIPDQPFENSLITTSLAAAEGEATIKSTDNSTDNSTSSTQFKAKPQYGSVNLRYRVFSQDQGFGSA